LPQCTTNVADGSNARITASQHFCPLHPNKPTQDGLNAEIAQRAPQIVLNVERLGPAKAADWSAAACDGSAGQRLHMHRPVQANTHHLCNAARIIANR
jgi:hypothetical protein